MKGKLSFSIQNRHIAFKFELERNITIITGDSGTGKTKLINMVRAYSVEGKSSGVSLRCKKPCVVLEGYNWEAQLKQITNSVVFIEESTKFLTTHEFASYIQKTDNYYVIITREPLPQISYSIDSIKQIIKNEQTPKIEKVYKDISVRDILKKKYEAIIVEDSKTGFQFFSKVGEELKTACISANGKSNLIKELNKQKAKDILIIADAASLGSEIREITHFQRDNDIRIDLFLPESFEWLILKSIIFDNNIKVQEILKNPIDFIESSEYFNWERFFTDLLVLESEDKVKLKYPASKSKLPEGYMTKANMESIVNAMKK